MSILASFVQYMKSRADSVRRVTWVCGSEQVLVEEVVDHVRGRVGASDFDYVSLLAGVAPDRDIWAAANQYPVDPRAPRLVLVRDVHRVKRWKPLEQWLEQTRTLPTVHLLLVSGDDDFTYAKGDDDHPVLSPPCYWIRHHSAGDLVKCAPLATTVPLNRDRKPTRPGPADVVQWLQGHCPMDENVADHLLSRVGGDLARAKNVARKAALFDGNLSENAIDALCSEEPAEDFVARLVALDKREASEAAAYVPSRDYARVVGELEYRLNISGKVYDLLRQRKTLKDAAVAGMSPYVAKLVWDSAKHYDDQRQAHCRQLLAMIDDSIQSGQRDGVLEALVAYW